jgi:hypothetical protein
MIEPIGMVKFDKQSGKSLHDEDSSTGQAEEFISIVKAFIKGINTSRAQSLEVGVSDIINMFETFNAPKAVVKEREKPAKLFEKESKETVEVETDVDDEAVSEPPQLAPHTIEDQSEATYSPSATFVTGPNNLNISEIDNQSSESENVEYEEAVVYLPTGADDPTYYASDKVDPQPLKLLSNVLPEPDSHTSNEKVPVPDQTIEVLPNALVQAEGDDPIENPILEDGTEPIFNQSEVAEHIKVDSMARPITDYVAHRETDEQLKNLPPQQDQPSISTLPESPDVIAPQGDPLDVVSHLPTNKNVVEHTLNTGEFVEHPLPIVEGPLQLQALIQNLSSVFNVSQPKNNQSALINSTSDVLKELNNTLSLPSQTVAVLDKSSSEDRSLMNSNLVGGSQLEKKATVSTQLTRFFPKMIEKIANLAEEVERSKDGRSLSIRIDPPHLGKIKVDMTLKDGSVHTRLTAESALVAHFLRERGDELQALIRKALPFLDQATIGFSMVGDSDGEDLARNSGHYNYPQQSSFSEAVEHKGSKGVLAASRNLPGDVKSNSTPSWIA